MAKDKITELWSFMQSEGFTLPDKDEAAFRESMKDDNKKRKIYQALKQNNLTSDAEQDFVNNLAACYAPTSSSNGASQSGKKKGGMAFVPGFTGTGADYMTAARNGQTNIQQQASKMVQAGVEKNERERNKQRVGTAITDAELEAWNERQGAGDVPAPLRPQPLTRTSVIETNKDRWDAEVEADGANLDKEFQDEIMPIIHQMEAEGEELLQKKVAAIMQRQKENKVWGQANTDEVNRALSDARRESVDYEVLIYNVQKAIGEHYAHEFDDVDNMSDEEILEKQYKLEKKVQRYYDNLYKYLIAKSVPKDNAEYMLRNFVNSSILASMITMPNASDTQKQIMTEGMNQYDAPGWARVTSGALALAADGPIFSGYGAIGSELTTRLLTRYGTKALVRAGMEKAAVTAAEAIDRALMNKGMRVVSKVIPSTMSFAGYGAVSYPVSTISQGQEYSFKEHLKKTGEEGLKGAVLGVYNGFVGEATSRLAGGAKLAAKGGSFVGEVGIFTGFDILEQHAAGVEWDQIDYGKTFLDQLAFIGGLKIQGAARSMPGRVERSFEAARQAQTWKAAPRQFISEFVMPDVRVHNGVILDKNDKDFFTDGDFRELKSIGIDGRRVSDVYDQFVHSRSKTGAVNEGAVEQLLNAYETAMNSKDVSANLKAKMRFLMENKISSEMPITCAYQVIPAREGGYALQTFGLQNELLRIEYFDTEAEANRAARKQDLERVSIVGKTLATVRVVDQAIAMQNAEIVCKEAGIGAQEFVDASMKSPETRTAAEAELIKRYGEKYKELKESGKLYQSVEEQYESIDKLLNMAINGEELTNEAVFSAFNALEEVTKRGEEVAARSLLKEWEAGSYQPDALGEAAAWAAERIHSERGNVLEVTLSDGTKAHLVKGDIYDAESPLIVKRESGEVIQTNSDPENANVHVDATAPVEVLTPEEAVTRRARARGIDDLQPGHVVTLMNGNDPKTAGPDGKMRVMRGVVVSADKDTDTIIVEVEDEAGNPMGPESRNVMTYAEAKEMISTAEYGKCLYVEDEAGQPYMVCEFQDGRSVLCYINGEVVKAYESHEALMADGYMEIADKREALPGADAPGTGTLTGTGTQPAANAAGTGAAGTGTGATPAGPSADASGTGAAPAGEAAGTGALTGTGTGTGTGAGRSALDRIPMKNGKRDYSAGTVNDVADAFVEKAKGGSEEQKIANAKKVAASQLKFAEADLAKAVAKREKGATDQRDPDAMFAAEEAMDQQVAAMEKVRDHWKAVYDELERRERDPELMLAREEAASREEAAKIMGPENKRVSTEEMVFWRDMANSLGVKFGIAAGMEGAAGSFEGDKMELWMKSEYAQHSKIWRNYIGHEFTHALRWNSGRGQEELWKIYRDHVEAAMGSEAFEAACESVHRLYTDLYKKIYKRDITREEIEEEVCCDFAGKHLFEKDPARVKVLVDRVNAHGRDARGFVRSTIDALKNLYTKLKQQFGARDPQLAEVEAAIKTWESMYEYAVATARESKAEAPSEKSEGTVAGGTKSALPSLKPIGKGFFGNIYNQFKGKAKEAFDFLLNNKSGDLLGVFNRNDVGDIDMVWGDDNGGLKHIIEKHINDKDFKTIEEMSYSIEDVINNGTIDFKDGDKIVIKKGGYVVTIRKNFRRNGKKIADKNWILTAYNKDTPINTLAPAAKIKGGTAVTTSVSSERKGTTSSGTDQTNGGEILPGEKSPGTGVGPDAEALSGARRFKIGPVKREMDQEIAKDLGRRYGEFREMLSDGIEYDIRHGETPDMTMLFVANPRYENMMEEVSYWGVMKEMLGAAGKFKTAKEFAEYAQKDKMAFEIPIRDFVDRQIKEKYGLRRPEGEEEGGMLSPLKAYYQAKKELAFVKENIEPHYAEYQDENGQWKAEVYEAAWEEARKVKKDGEGFSGYLDFFNSLRKAHLLIESSDEAKRLYKSFVEAKKLGWVRIRKEEEKNAPYPFEQMADGTFYFGEFPKFKAEKPANSLADENNVVRISTPTDKNLVAVHNINEKSLGKAIELGGFAMPSIAVTKAELGHEDFGDISLLFSKETINPTDRRNVLWDRDSWSPTFPEVQKKLSEKVLAAASQRLGELVPLDKRVSRIDVDESNLYDTLRRFDWDAADAFANNAGMKQAYLASMGKNVRLPMREKTYSHHSNSLLQKIIDLSNETGIDLSNSRVFFEADENPAYKAVVDRVKEIVLDDRIEKNSKRIAANPEIERVMRERYDMSFSEFDNLVYDAYRMKRDMAANGGKIPQIVDAAAAAEDIDKKVSSTNKKYREWITNLFDGIVEKEGIRNERDIFTPSGNRRSFEQTHDPVTLHNVVAAMMREAERGGKGFFGSNIFGASANKFGSISEMKSQSDRLQRIDKEENRAIEKSFTEEFAEIAHHVTSDGIGDTFDFRQALTEAVAKTHDAKGIYKELHPYWKKFTMADAEKVEDIVNRIGQMAVDYFEAKPNRAVSLNEVKAAVVPKGTDKSLVAKLKQEGIKVVTYDKNVEGARVKAVDKAATKQNIKFKVGDKDSPIFVSNAAEAVKGIKQEKAPASQWLAMLEKNGGLKAGEDKWLGLRSWLGEQAVDALAGKRDKNITKDEILDYIAKNDIRIEEVKYGVLTDETQFPDKKKIEEFAKPFVDEYESLIKQGVWRHDAYDQMRKKYGDLDFLYAFEVSEDGNTIYLKEDEDGFYTEGAMNFVNKRIGYNPIDVTRLDYTTEGLENKKEIALTVPTIEPYKENDQVHFGDAGGGRAVAWVRFGDATSANADGTVAKVLVIDEIQSKRHQDGREKGYANQQERDAAKKHFDEVREKILANHDGDFSAATEEELKEFNAASDRINKADDALDYGVPDAPFDKNWHELAMKRMLRYAAENGYDKVAWTTGAQQAERYNIGGVVKRIRVFDTDDFAREEGEYKNVEIDLHNQDPFFINIDKDGNIMSAEGYDEYRGRHLSDVVGKELADKIINSKNGEAFEGDGLKVGGEGMKGFYDQMLPSFMNKYGKKWGVKVGEVELDLPNEADRKMWSVDVNDAMKADVMRGQKKFALKKYDREGNEIGDGSNHESYEVIDFSKDYPQINSRVSKSNTSESVYVTYSANGKTAKVRFSRHNNNATRLGEEIVGIKGSPRTPYKVLEKLGLIETKVEPRMIPTIKTRDIAKKNLENYEEADLTLDELKALPIGSDISEYVGKRAKGSNKLIEGDVVGEREDGRFKYYNVDGEWKSAAELLAKPSDKSEGTGGTRYAMEDIQGNPLNQDGTLKVEKISSIDEITDEDFTAPTRNVELPKLPKNVDEAIGAKGKPMVIKKNIFEKNKLRHKDLSSTESRKILHDVLYTPNLYGQNQKATRPYNWILVHLADKNEAVLIEVNENKDNLEIINWHYLREASLKQKERQAIEEGGRILTLESAAGDALNSLSSGSKNTQNNSLVQENGGKILPGEKSPGTGAPDGGNKFKAEGTGTGTGTGATEEQLRARQPMGPKDILARHFANMENKLDNVHREEDMQRYTNLIVNDMKETLAKLKQRHDAGQEYLFQRNVEGAKMNIERGMKRLVWKSAQMEASWRKSVQEEMERFVSNIITGMGGADQTTVREIMRNLSHTQRVKNMDDVRLIAHNIFDAVLRGRERKLKETIDGQLKLRGTGTSKNGGNAMKEVDERHQKTIEGLRKRIDAKMEAPELQREKEDINKEISAIGKLPEEMTETEKQRYSELERKMNEIALYERYKEAVDAYDAELRGLYDDFSKAKTQSARAAIRESIIESEAGKVKAMNDFSVMLKEYTKEGREGKHDFLEGKEMERQKIRYAVLSDLKGVKASPYNPGHVGFGAWSTLNGVMKALGRHSSSGRGRLWQIFIPEHENAVRTQQVGLEQANKMLNEIANKASVKEFGRQVKFKDWASMGKWATKHYAEMEKTMPVYDEQGNVVMNEDGSVKTTTVVEKMTINSLLYIHACEKMSDGRAKLRAMGITEENVTEMREMMRRDTVLKQFIDAIDEVQDKVLPKLKEKYNLTHKKLFGVGMADVEDYFPIHLDKDSYNENIDIGVTKAANMPSTMTGAIKKRTKNSLPLDLTNYGAFDVVLHHILQMEQWNAFAPLREKSNMLLNDLTLKRKINSVYDLYGSGKALYETLEKNLMIACGLYRPKQSRLTKFFMALKSGLVARNVAFNLNTARKQLTSIFAAFGNADPMSVIASIGNSVGSIRWAWKELPDVRARLEQGDMGYAELQKELQDDKGIFYLIDKARALGRSGFNPNKWVDVAVCCAVAKSCYDSQKRFYKKMGLSEEKASERAKMDASIAYNESQQSSQGAYMSELQSERSFGAAMATVYRNSPMSYGRMIWDSVRNIKRQMTDRKGILHQSSQMWEERGLTPEQAMKAAKKEYTRDFIKNVATILSVHAMNTAWYNSPNMIYYLLGQDDDKKKEMAENAQWLALVDDVVQGIPVVGPAASIIATNIMRGGALSSIYKEFRSEHDWKIFKGVIDDIFAGDLLLDDVEEVGKAVFSGEVVKMVNSGINHLGSILTGTSPKLIANAVNGVVQACHMEAEPSMKFWFGLMAIMSHPRDAKDQLFVDMALQALGDDYAEAVEASKDGKVKTKAFAIDNEAYEEVLKAYIEYCQGRDMGFYNLTKKDVPFLEEDAEEQEDRWTYDKEYSAAKSEENAMKRLEKLIKARNKIHAKGGSEEE